MLLCTSVCAKLYVAYILNLAKWNSIQYDLLKCLIGPEQNLQPIAIAPVTVVFAVEVWPAEVDGASALHLLAVFRQHCSTKLY